MTQTELQRLLNYEPLSGNFYWKESRGRIKTGDLAGWYCKGYLCITINKVRYRSARLVWLYVHGQWPEHEMDHINRVRDDNRLSNLRDVTHAVNMENRDV